MDPQDGAATEKIVAPGTTVHFCHFWSRLTPYTNRRGNGNVLLKGLFVVAMLRVAQTCVVSMVRDQFMGRLPVTERISAPADEFHEELPNSTRILNGYQL
jgi:hypothetical protein